MYSNGPFHVGCDAQRNPARPSILGALHSAVSGALRDLPSVKLARLPRMADFAAWATAAETGLGWKRGTFMNAYTGNRAEAADLAIEADPVAMAVVTLIEKESTWTGSATELLHRLAGMVEDAVLKSSDWPKKPNRLSGRLRRAAPLLRKRGVDITFLRPGHGGRRRIFIVSTVTTVSADRDGLSIQEHTANDGGDDLRHGDDPNRDGDDNRAADRQRAIGCDNGASREDLAQGDEGEAGNPEYSSVEFF